MNKKSKRIALCLSVINLILLFLPGFTNFKYKRLKITARLSAQTTLENYFYIILGISVLVILLLLFNAKWKEYTVFFLYDLSVPIILIIVANAISRIPYETTPYSRLSFGPVAWIWLASVFCIIIKLSEFIKNKKILYGLSLLPFLAIAVLLMMGKLDGLSILREYENIKDMYLDSLQSHIVLSAVVILNGILIGVPLGYVVNQNAKAEKIIFGILNITETIPGISFIAILMIPFAYLSRNYPALREYGIKEFGSGPAIIVLVFYAVFPIIHNTRAAFKGIDDKYVEIALAMGMTRRRVFFKILVPMAFPTILSGIRLATVYTISGVTLAAMIGGGGLGYFMLTSDSMDKVLLGVIPIVIMTFVADKGLKYISDRMIVREGVSCD